MERIRRGLGLAVAMLAIAGCSSVSKNQCLVGDWQTVGYRDGLAGIQSTALLRHQNTCLKHGVTPDREAYLHGWREGVDRYCQPDHAFDVGNSGAGYANVCPEHLDRDFRVAYQDGRRLHLARVELDNLQCALDQREARLRDVKAELAGIAGAAVHPDSTAPDLAAMVLAAKDLAEEKGRLEAEIAELRRDLAARRSAL